MPSADERHARCSVMRRAKRRSPHEPAAVERGARGRVDARRLERGLVVELGQQARKATGEHRLAGAGRADEEQVMTAGGRDLEGEPRQRLAASPRRDRVPVAEAARASAAADRATARRPGARRPARRACAPRAPCAARGASPRGRRARTDDDRRAVEGADEREDSGHRADRAVEAELADEADALTVPSGNVVARDEKPDGDREIEARAHLAQRRRREVHRDALVGPLEAGAHERGSHRSSLPGRRCRGDRRA